MAHVRNGIAKPRPHGWERVESDVVFPAGATPRLGGLDGYSHVIVVFYMDLAARAPEMPDQLVLEGRRRFGIFATRSQLRPNHLGVAVVELLAVEGETLRVRGLDAIDGTAVLDVKPYLPAYDSIPGAAIPGA